MRFCLIPLLVLLPGLALAQDPQPVGSKPAAAAVAEAIVKLADKKQLGRLSQPRHYVMRRSGEVFLIRLHGGVSDSTAKMDAPDESRWALRLTLQVRRFARPGTIEFVYDIGPKGTLQTLGMTEVRKEGKAEELRGIQGTIRGGKLSARRIPVRKGVDDTFELPWSDNCLPAIYLWFVVPSLFDQGLPRQLNPEVVIEEKLRAGRKFEPTTFSRTSEKPFKNKAGLLIHTFETKGKHDTTTVAVIADGKRKGLVLQVKVGRSRTFDLISKAEYEKLEQDAPLIANEAKAQKVLSSLHYAQDTHQKGKGSFAATLEPLEAKHTYFAKQLTELQKVYLVLMLASPDGSKWMAIAVPAEPGKTGKRYFVINQDGKFHTSGKKLELDDSCAIPSGAKPVD